LKVVKTSATTQSGIRISGLQDLAEAGMDMIQNAAASPARFTVGMHDTRSKRAFAAHTAKFSSPGELNEFSLPHLHHRRRFPL
jgi:hypothetical protein